MRTLGIDLASQPKKTAAASIEWDAEIAQVRLARARLRDAELLELAASHDHVGIDSPFGWPRPFVEFVQAHRGAALPEHDWADALSRSLRLRTTDLRVHERSGKYPLSVSSDMVALIAMRCATLLAKLGVTDRSGAGKVVEVYPGASLRVWQLAGKIKASDAELLARLLARTSEWLRWDDAALAACHASRDCFDAVVASLITRAAALGLTHPPSPDEVELAREEGWIALPIAGSLERLCQPPTQ